MLDHIYFRRALNTNLFIDTIYLKSTQYMRYHKHIRRWGGFLIMPKRQDMSFRSKLFEARKFHTATVVCVKLKWMARKLK